jgi:hypothetical protein
VAVSVDQIVEQVRVAAEAGRPCEVWGGGSLLSVFGDPDVERLEAAALTGVRAFEPADLVITVGAGMTVVELDELLLETGQECPLDIPTGEDATVGGRVATGLGGVRRLGCGPVRDWVLGMTVVTGDGAVVDAGGRTVKNVTGYDLPRLYCGSWGTLGPILEVTLRVRPRPRWSGWFQTDAPIGPIARQLYRPASVLTSSSGSWILLEGHPKDADDLSSHLGLQPCAEPDLPTGLRVSVPPAHLDTWLAGLPAHGWVAEWGVGTVHLEHETLDNRQAAALEAIGGRQLRLRSPKLAEDLATVAGHQTVHARLRRACDPHGVFAPWRFAT